MTVLTPSSPAWLAAVLNNFDTFLLDHAANERKASSMAMSMVAHYPDRTELTRALIDLALEELNHFRQVFRLIDARGLILGADEKDLYINDLRRSIRKSSEEYLLDRLLSAAVIEARGAERFAQIGCHLNDDKLAIFYQSLAKSEAQHYELFIDLAYRYCDKETVNQRFDEWLHIEADVIDQLPIRPKLH